MSDKTKISTVVFIIIVIIFSISGCTHKSSEEEGLGRTAIVPVKIATIMTGDMDEMIQANGLTEALRKESLLSPAAGRISELRVQEGQSVKVGDTVAVIHTRESISELEGAEALLQQAKTPEQKAEAEKSVKLAESYQNHVAVKSRISGIVATRSVTEGAMVIENSELLTVIDPQSIDFVAQVPLKELGRIRKGQDARVNLIGLLNTTLVASVRSINPQADSSNQTARVLLRFNDYSNGDAPGLINGMAGAARIIVGEHKNVMIVPLAAVLRNDETNTYSVVTVTADSLSKTVTVSPGITRDSTTEISSPDLHAGMPVIIEGNYALPDSTRVTVGHKESR